MLAVWSGSARAQDDASQRASEHFARAEAAEHSGDWATAYSEYDAAYTALPHPDVLYNMAAMSERLGETARAIDLYRRYLSESNPRPSDAPQVEAIIVSLERSLAANPTTDHDTVEGAPRPTVTPPPRAVDPYATTGVVGSPAVTATAEARPYAWRLGASYGLGLGDVPVERYQVVGSIQAVHIGLAADFVAGLQGRNDIGVGAGARFWVPFGGWRPFLRVLGTVGYATTDASSGAEIAFPMSVEAGVGIAWAGPKGEIYAVAGPRFTFGGVAESDTLSDSHINDSRAVTIDFGLVFGSQDATRPKLIE